MSWQKQLPVIPPDITAKLKEERRLPICHVGKSWLVRTSTGLGCSVCAAVAQSGGLTDATVRPQHRKYATFCVAEDGAQLVHLRKHAASALHRRNVLNLVGATDLLAEDILLDTPSTTAFSTTLEVLRKGSPPAAGVEGVGKRTKVERLEWCLCEAVLELDRQCLNRDDISITLVRDERQQRLLVRFVASGNDLVRHSGELGQSKNFGTSAEALTTATHDILKRFATRNLDPPHCCRRNIQPPTLDDTLFQRLRAGIEGLTIDSAADELLGAEQLRKGNRELLAPLCPNLKVITRDKAHGSRRQSHSLI